MAKIPICSAFHLHQQLKPLACLLIVDFVTLRHRVDIFNFSIIKHITFHFKKQLFTQKFLFSLFLRQRQRRRCVNRLTQILQNRNEIFLLFYSQNSALTNYIQRRKPESAPSLAFSERNHQVMKFLVAFFVMSNCFSHHHRRIKVLESVENTPEM